MALPLLSDGNNPILAISGAQLSHTDWNEMMGQLSDVFKARYLAAIIGVGFGVYDNAAVGWEFQTGPPPYIFNDVGSGQVMYLPIPVREGGSIVQIRGMVNGTNAGGLPGSIRLVRIKRQTPLPSVVVVGLELGASEDFDLGGTLAVFSHNVSADASGDAVAELVKDDHQYFFQIGAPTGGGGNEAFVYQLGVTFALGKVTGAV